MLNNFIYAQTKALFLEQLGAGNILDEAIVFIADTKEIWNHGTYFGTSEIDPEVFNEIQTKIAQLETNATNFATKDEIPTLVSELDNDAGYLTEHQSLDHLVTKETYEADEVVIAESLNDLNTRVTNVEGSIPTKTSDLENDSGFIKASVVSDNYVTKSSLTEINSAIATLESDKLSKEDADSIYATDEFVTSHKQDRLVSGLNIKTINEENILGSGNITIDLSVLDSVGTSEVRPMSQKATTDALNEEITRATTKENELETRISEHESITEETYNLADDANVYAQSAYTQSTEAVNTANAAKNAVATLEGLANTDTAQTTLAATVIQIEQNTTDVQLLKDKHVILTEADYEALELKDPDKIYLIYEE